MMASSPMFSGILCALRVSAVQFTGERSTRIVHRGDAEHAEKAPKAAKRGGDREEATRRLHFLLPTAVEGGKRSRSDLLRALCASAVMHDAGEDLPRSHP